MIKNRKKFLSILISTFVVMMLIGAIGCFAESTTDLGVVDEVFSVFTKVGEWISSNLPTFVSLFYNSTTGLTFMGVLALCSLGISVCFLLLGIIQSFLKFRS